jgi:hypothetical protein
MGPIGSPETSVTNYQHTLPNSLQELSSLRHIPYVFMSRSMEYGATTFLNRKTLKDSVKLCEEKHTIIYTVSVINVYICVYWYIILPAGKVTGLPSCKSLPINVPSTLLISISELHTQMPVYSDLVHLISLTC